MVSSFEAAKYLCSLSKWQLSNLKLQKILYLADLNFLGNTGNRLIDEDFEAWDYGPVLTSLYHRCKPFGSKDVPNVFWGVNDLEKTSPEALMLNRAWEKLRSQTPGQLVANTHWERGAWVKRYVPGAKGIKISTVDMCEEYSERRAS